MMIEYFPKSKQFDGKFRLQRLIENINLEKIKTVLYVGIRPNRADHLSLFNGKQIYALEIWERNIRIMIENNCWPVCKYFSGDIVNWNTDMKFDLVFWWHGPEHVEKNKLNEAVANCEKLATQMVVMGCPWGDYLSHEFSKNPHERHVSELEPEFFDQLGYYVEAQGKRGPGSNLMAIKYLT